MCWIRPYCSTPHGSSPRSARRSSAIETPKSTSPTSSWVTRCTSRPARSCSIGFIGRARHGGSRRDGAPGSGSCAHPAPKVALVSMANPARVATMSTPTVSAARTARLVGVLAPGRPAYRGARRRAAPRRRRRPHRGGHPAAQRARPDGGPRREPHDGDPGVCRAARERLPHLPPRLGLAWRPCRPGGRSRGAGSLFPADVEDGRHRPHVRRDRAPRPASSRPTSGPCSSCRAYLAGAGYLTLGVPELREVVAARYTERGLPTSADEVLVDLRRRRRHSASCCAPCSATATASSSRTPPTPTPSTPCAAAGPGSSRSRWTPTAGTSPRPSRVVRSAAAARGRAHPRLPQPHRRAHDRRRAGDAGAGPCSAARTVPVVDETIAELVARRRRPAAPPLRRPRPAHRQRGQLVEVPLGRAAHRLDPRTAQRPARPRRGPGHDRPRRPGARAARAPRADARSPRA